LLPEIFIKTKNYGYVENKICGENKIKRSESKIIYAQNVVNNKNSKKVFERKIKC
jgi:hypothetical protein